MKKLIVIILVFFWYQVLYAQNIVQVEHFFDTDPGYGNGTDVPITPGQNITADFVADLGGLGNGFHILYVRAKWAPGFQPRD